MGDTSIVYGFVSQLGTGGASFCFFFVCTIHVYSFPAKHIAKNVWGTEARCVRYLKKKMEVKKSLQLWFTIYMEVF